jgi:hypothetical protein
MIKFITILSFFLIVLCGFTWLLLNIYLTIKLRKKKKRYIQEIVNSAPDKYKRGAEAFIGSNPSWVFASSAGHLWCSYLVLRFIWKIPRSEINQWHEEIKKYFRVIIFCIKY